MKADTRVPDARKVTQEILGYLNFSNGAQDVGFLRNLDTLYALIEGSCDVRDALPESTRDDEDSQTRIVRGERGGRGCGLTAELVQHVAAREIVRVLPRFP